MSHLPVRDAGADAQARADRKAKQAQRAKCGEEKPVEEHVHRCSVFAGHVTRHVCQCGHVWGKAKAQFGRRAPRD